MSTYGRIEIALDHDFAARKQIALAEITADPVEQRRALVRAAKSFRKAADELDDKGYLTE